MGKFEFFMTFYSLILGLAVTELFAGFGNLLREKTVPKPGVLIPLMGAIVLVETMANFIDAWDRYQSINITLLDMALPTVVGICYFVLAVLVVPRNMTDWSSLDEYFRERRCWFAGILLVANTLIVLQEPGFVARGLSEGDYWGVAIYVGGNLWLFTAYLTLLLRKSRVSALASMCLALLYYPAFYIVDITGLFSNSA